MKTFCTTKTIKGVRFSGRKIKAKSFESAKKQAKRLGLTIDGQLMSEHIYYSEN